MIWIYLVFNLAATLLWFAIVERKNPGLAKERLRPGSPDREGRLGLLALVATSLAHYLIAGLDVGRFHWSDSVPFRAQVAGLIGYAAAFGVFIWAMSVNPFFSSVVRIQRDRGQRVITTGPYKYVRHPAYLVGIFLLLLDGLALGSRWSLVPAALWIPALLRRTIVEDKLLRAELEGYEAYAQRVRYRLVPGIW